MDDTCDHCGEPPVEPDGLEDCPDCGGQYHQDCMEDHECG